MMISVAIGGIVLTAVAQLMSYSGRSLAALYNYVDLDARSNAALKRMSKEIRQANYVMTVTSNSLTLNDFDGGSLQFAWNPATKLVTRLKNGISTNLLLDCEYLDFKPFARNPIGGTYDQYPSAGATNCKLVQVTWVCSRKVLGVLKNTESVQSAKFVIRKE
jgi:hypothetical protein